MKKFNLIIDQCIDKASYFVIVTDDKDILSNKVNRLICFAEIKPIIEASQTTNLSEAIEIKEKIKNILMKNNYNVIDNGVKYFQ